MADSSAGLLLYRITDGRVEVLLVHPGGPFFRNKDLGAWSIPKGLPEPGEALLDAARREFEEETAVDAGAGPFASLGEVRQRGGKRVTGWAVRGDCDPAECASNSFEIEWPPRSGRRQSFPEVDAFEFFDLATARVKINPAQAAFLDRLEELLDGDGA